MREKNKKIALLVLTSIGLVVLLIYITVESMKSPYLKALETLKYGEDIYREILYHKKADSYDGKKVKLYGYISKKKSRLYGNSDDIYGTWPGTLNNSVLIYSDFKNKKLLMTTKCKGGDNLVELHGIFYTTGGDNEGGKDYYLADIEKIYDFDTLPKDQGGGARYECYSVEINK